jgi:hypothetical protein
VYAIFGASVGEDQERVLQHKFTITVLLFLFVLQYLLDSGSSKVQNIPKLDESVLAVGGEQPVPQYHLKASFFVLGSPDELLKLILDESVRNQWDVDLVSARLNEAENKTILSY